MFKKVYLKHIILIIGIFAAFSSFDNRNLGAGTTAAGALIAFAIIEINDVKMMNQKEDI